ncbi:MAG: tyrosine-type recombinase/integrase [Alteromonadaceae bacterium]|nr:tyrosine-type recombinase/integrase [Alteromonadaceae bacterium]
MRRQRKPYVTEKKGRLYYRLRWTDGETRRERFIPLPGDEDSPEFDRTYWAIRSGTHEAVTAAPRTSWKHLIASYRKTRAFTGLAAGTRRKYEAVMIQLEEKNGDRDIRKVTRQHVRAIHEKYSETPRKADHYLQVIRLLLNFAKNELDWIDNNPATGIKLFGAQKEWEPWSPGALKAFRSAADETMLTAMMLGTGTGQRPGDLCGMMWEHFDGEYIAVTQDKTKERIKVFCPRELRDYLATLPKRGRFILAKNLTEPINYDSLQKLFAKTRKKAGTACDGLVMHGWRYTAAVALAEAGCSDAEIQSVTGHRTAAMAQKYRRAAGQKALSRQAQNRRDG